MAIFMVMALLVAPSAFAWLWPILGFSHSCIGYPIKNKPLPGTPQWPFFPDSGRAELVRPGDPYCPVCGFMDVGPVPPMAGRPCPTYLPAEAPARNETAPEKNISDNRSAGNLRGEKSALMPPDGE